MALISERALTIFKRKSVTPFQKESKKHWLVRPENIRLLWRFFIFILALTVAAEFLIHPHPYFWIDGTFGFHAWYGLSTCVAMVVLAKGLGKFLKRKDTYYD